jgi:polyhydroxyalkanoate synthase
MHPGASSKCSVLLGGRTAVNKSGRTVSVEAALDAFVRAPFAVSDIVRRAQGEAVGALGLDPVERPYRVIASGVYWRLRDYAEGSALLPLLIVAAPIKRPYIWDLAPVASAIGYCLEQRQHVYLLEWMAASPRSGNHGLDEYVQAIAECVAKIRGAGHVAKPCIVGHSLGGTLAAIFGAWAPKRIRGLVLLGAPLCFEPQTSKFRDALVSLVPSTLSEAEPYPGSLLSHISALASPGTFIWSRLMDAAISVTDAHAINIHARVERWALDEVPLPGKLVHQIIEWLYREDSFCRGTLQVNGKRVGPFSLSVPMLAVVNTADEVAPLPSIEPFIHAMPKKDVRIIEYTGEVGVCLQHLGILVGREARAQVWPEIIAWLEARRE